MFANLSDRQKAALQIIFVLGLLGAALAIMTYMGGFISDEESHRLRFDVVASGGYAVVTLDAGTAQIASPKQVTVPWSQTVRVDAGTEVYLTASNPSATGEVTCSITLDGKPWKEDKTTAPNNGVACAGIVP